MKTLPKNSKSQEDTYYQAMLARDPRFDGKFFVGVKTTGIYCRPICPARPKRQNVVFYPSSLAAEKAGFRPCLRCRPESAPQSKAWIGKSAVVERALKMLNHPQRLDFNEDEFAERFGVSARHLRRLFNDEIGKTPKQIAFEQRLNLSRQLLVESQLPVTEVAFAAGFRSIRRFNDAFKDRFKKSPSQIRRSKLSSRAPLALWLSYRPPFDFVGLLRIYQSHQTGRLEWFSEQKMFRLVEFNKKVGWISIEDHPCRSALRLEIDFPDSTQIHAIVSKVRAMFDLDSDPVLVANALETIPQLGKLWRRHSGIRLPSGWDGFELGVAAILGQLVSVERGRALVNDLIEALGEDSRFEREGHRVKLFPSPQKIADADLTFLKTTGQRKYTLQEFARRVARGELSLEPTQDVNLFFDQVLSIKGIGPWTAHYMALKILRHTDAFPATDLILARALKLYPTKAVAALSPWRGYLAALLWREYAQSLSQKKKTDGSKK